MIIKILSSLLLIGLLILGKLVSDFMNVKFKYLWISISSKLCYLDRVC